jgi:hypothetical protein
LRNSAADRDENDKTTSERSLTTRKIGGKEFYVTVCSPKDERTRLAKNGAPVLDRWNLTSSEGDLL